MAFTTVVGMSQARRAGRDQQRLIEQGYQNDLLNAQDNLAAAHHSAGFSFAMADQIEALAGQKLEINRQRAAYRMMQGEYDLQVGRVLHDQYDDAANEALAISSREAYAANEQGEAAVSAGITAAASGGILVEDVSRLLAEVSTDARYNTAVKVWEGKTSYNRLRYEGDIKQHEGEVSYTAAQHEHALMLAEGDLTFQYDLVEAESIRHGAEMEIFNANLGLESIQRSGPQAQQAGAAARRSGNQQALAIGLQGAGNIAFRQSQGSL